MVNRREAKEKYEINRSLVIVELDLDLYYTNTHH
jgi:hypothetical protein